MKRSILALASCLIPLASLAAKPADDRKGVQAPKKPNIVFIMADDLAYTALGCYGNSEVKTPHMDKLGSEGLIFDNHYNTTSICMASRAIVMTGMYEYKTGCNFSHGSLTRDKFMKSYPVLLRKAGYLTAFAGKFGFGVHDKPSSSTSVKNDTMPIKEFDVWGGSEGQTDYKTSKNPNIAKYAAEYPHSSRAYGAFGQDFIKKAKAEKKPFCLSVFFKAPHKPSQPDPAFDDVYKGKTFTKPVNFGRENGKHFSAQSKMGRQWGRWTDWGYDKDYDQAMRDYNQLVYGVDVAVGMIREELAKHNLTEKTVIIFASDNGYANGAHGYGAKVLPYEEFARVPLMIYDPRHSVSGKKLRSKALTGGCDIAPTILELAGLSIPGNIDGKSLLPLLDKPESDIREVLPLMNVFGKDPVHHLAVVSKEWKYNYWWFAKEGLEPAEELFNTEEDMYEMKNLISDAKSKNALEAMRKRYDEQLALYKKNVVSYNGYAKYGELFDRNIPWRKKNFSRNKSGSDKSDKKKKKKKKKKSKT